MTSPDILEREIREDALLLISLERDAVRAIADGNIQHASEIWANRDVIRVRRSYLMRMLWTHHGLPLPGLTHGER